MTPNVRHNFERFFNLLINALIILKNIFLYIKKLFY